MSVTLAGKRIIVGVSGSIAAFKVAGWVSTLSKEEARVSVVMTDSAKNFITPLTFAAITGESPYVSMFDEAHNSAMAHIELAQEASLFLLAPATAQTIARLAHGFADDLLSATILATRAPVVICPAMNTQMYLHKATQENIKRVKELGYTVIDPASGAMACKDDGPGRLVEWEVANEVVRKSLTLDDLRSKKVLITAGPTRETIDPARFISNRSTGKMGYALAREAYRRGAEVTLISGPTSLDCPYGVKRIEVGSAKQMYDAVIPQCGDYDIIIKSAAVSDFRSDKTYSNKIKKEKADGSIHLLPNPDILLELGKKKKKNQFLAGFAAESENILVEAKKKLEKKNLDLIVVNDISKQDAGFEVDTNKVFLMDGQNSAELPLVSKLKTAELIWDHICRKVSAQL